MTNLLTIRKRERERMQESLQIGCRTFIAECEVYIDKFSEFF